jgi:vitamin B12 transporter
MSKKHLTILAAILAGYYGFSQDTTATGTLDEVVVTANKYPQKQSTTGKVLMVIGREQLEKNTGRTIGQVLNEQAGFFINGAQNPLGSNQTVFVRGASAANTLILVDGIPANDASGISGEFDINHFSIDMIERIEILKGAQSVLYGSDAVAGVINIITRKNGSKRAIGANATLAAGSYGTFKATAGAGGKTKVLDYSLQYTRLQSNGFSAANDAAGNGNFDKDGYDQDVASLNVTAKATENWKIRLFGQYDKYRADIDDAAFTDDRNNTIRNQNIQAGLGSVWQIGNHSLNFNFNLNNTKRELRDEVNTPVLPGDFDPSAGLYKSRTLFGEVFGNFYLHKNIGLLVGADIRDQKADIETTFGKLGKDSLKATLVSGYTSVLLRSIGGFNAEIGARFTNHSEVGSAFTYSFNPSYTIGKQIKLFANIASGFRTPSLYNLASEYGNRDLDPERTMSYEGGVQFLNISSTVNLRATYFNRHIKDVIIFRSLSSPPYGQYDNADKQKDQGFEIEASWKPGSQWSISANYAFVDGKIETTTAGKDTSFFNLYRRPKHNFNFTAGFQATTKLYVSIGGRAVGKRQDSWYNPNSFRTEIKTLASYYNLDAYASYDVLSFLKLFADFRNITDQVYYDQYGYNTRKFNFMTGVIFKW